MTKERVLFIFVIFVAFVIVIALIIQASAKSDYEAGVIFVETENAETAIDEKTSNQETVSKPVVKKTEISSVPINDMETISPNLVAESCFVTGCNNQICSDQDDIATTCQWHETYACYNNATCERQPDGECGWTRTEEITQCFKETVPDLAIYIK